MITGSVCATPGAAVTVTDADLQYALDAAIAMLPKGSRPGIFNLNIVQWVSLLYELQQLRGDALQAAAMSANPWEQP